jgi:hypothetical protein
MRIFRVKPQRPGPGAPPLQAHGPVLQNAPMPATRVRLRALAPLLLVLLGACAAARGPAPAEVAWPDQGHDHIPGPGFPHAAYLSNPPTSGPHTPYVARWGVHEGPVPDEVLVHNLEHGGVVIGHRCTDCPAVVAELKALAEGYPLVVIAPNPELPAPVVLSAWRHTLSVERLDEPARKAIADFLSRHHGVDHHPRGHSHTLPPDPAP